MTDPARPVLVYDRIDISRRNTLLLLTAFVALLLPLSYGLAQLAVPFLLLNHFCWYIQPFCLPIAPAGIYGYVPPTEVSTLMVLLTLMFSSCVALSVYLALPYFVLWLADGHRVDQREELVLWRTVENLCIGAGLPQPEIYVVELSTPNAFSTARDSKHASLVVTRGLLRLLDERELRGVLAHELSHIGNGDTDLSDLLSALVATMRFPLATVELVPANILFPLIAFAGVMEVWFYGEGLTLSVREVMMFAGPLYAFFIAPAAGLFIRKTIAHQREFLADAEAALLTRDPEGLALALAKVSGATAFSVNAAVATAHLYFVDPLPRSWWNSTFPSHPSVEARIALLARMRDRIPTPAPL